MKLEKENSRLSSETPSSPPSSSWHTLGNAHAGWVLAAGLLVVVVGWLGWAGWVVNAEPYDGLDAVVNAGFFAGKSAWYVLNRSPFMSWLLLPAQLAATGLGLDSLDMRPYHLTTALLHGFYLLGVFFLLRRRYGGGMAVTAAFAAAVLTPVFFCYAPFISHDILPGFLGLSMLLCAERFAGKSCVGSWLGLVVLGTVSVLIKPLFGLFWVMVLAAEGVVVMRDKKWCSFGAWRSWIFLCGGAALSFVVYWIVMAWVTSGELGPVPFLLRPWEQIRFVMGQHAGNRQGFPLWLYLRNLPAYGKLATVLLVPGLILNWRSGSTFGRRLVVAWLTGFILIHLLEMREVRYLAFLMPITAFLLVQPLQALCGHSGMTLAACLLLAVDLLCSGIESVRLTDPFYTDFPARRFSDAVRKPDGTLRKPLFGSFMLTYLSPTPPIFSGDRYHRMFHVGLHQFDLLYHYDGERVAMIEGDLPVTVPAIHENAVLLYAPFIMSNPPAWRPKPPPDVTKYRIFVGVADTLPLPSKVTAPMYSADGGGMLRLAVPEAAALVSPFIALSLRDRVSGRVAPLQDVGADVLAFPWPGDVPVPRLEDISLHGFRLVHAAVPSPDGCSLQYSE